MFQLSLYIKLNISNSVLMHINERIKNVIWEFLYSDIKHIYSNLSEHSQAFSNALLFYKILLSKFTLHINKQETNE